MPLRSPAVAGQFYPGQTEELRSAVQTLLEDARGKAAPLEPGERHPLLTVLPHAGYTFCGKVIASTLVGLELPRRLVILAPNHTGQGHPRAYWSDGAWRTPLGDMPVDAELAQELAVLGGGFAPDIRSHLHEHDIEVLLPFLQIVRPDAAILPIAIAGPEGLPEAARALATLARKHNAPAEASSPHDGQIAFIISSDMNHYAPDTENRRRDALALDALLSLDPQRLFNVVSQHDISMCGIIPALIGLLVCNELHASHAHLAAYDTSASAFGDASRVVGYAGVHVW